jgi:hypothetical protein
LARTNTAAYFDATKCPKKKSLIKIIFIDAAAKIS